MKFNEIDDILKEKCVSKYNSMKEVFTKSKTMLAQYLTISSGTFSLLGQQFLTLFNDNSSQVQALLNPKFYALLSIFCGVLTIYFKYKDEKEKLKNKDSV